MIPLFPEINHRNGEESGTFCSRLTPIIEQIETIQIAPSHCPSVLLFALELKSYKACAKLVLKSISLDEMIDEIKKKILYNGEILDRRTTHGGIMTHSKSSVK